jgi:hypothetical protein
MGEQREKMGQYQQAVRCFNEGKIVAETNFGPKHELYTRCVNGIGGARLKSKYQTREVQEREMNKDINSSMTYTKSKKSKRVTSKSERKNLVRSEVKKSSEKHGKLKKKGRRDI